MGIREANVQGRKSLKSLSFAASTMGGLSIVSLFNAGFSISWVQPLRQIIEQYLVITNTFRHVVEPYVIPLFDALAEFLAIGINFGLHWPDIFLLTIIYLGSRVKSYFSGAKYFRAVAMLVLSICISVVVAYFASAVTLEFWSDVLIATAIPLLGFFVYDVVYASVGATLDRRGVSWPNEFIRHISFSLPLLIIELFLNAALSYVLVLNIDATPYQAFVVIFAINYFVIFMYWVYKSLCHAEGRNSRLMGESISERFWRSSATNVALNVGIALFSSILFMLFNAGLQTTGFEASHLLPKLT